MNDVFCLVCGEPGDRLCSSTCAASAERESQRNIAYLLQLTGQPGASARRYALALRNGQLDSALASWARSPQAQRI